MRDLRYGDLLRPRDRSYGHVILMYLAQQAHAGWSSLLLVRGQPTLLILSTAVDAGDVVSMPDSYLGPEMELIAP